jgi:hypothetical protein
MLVVACLMCFIHSCLSLLMATCVLSCYGLLIWIHFYFASFGMVMDIITQIHACMPCEAPYVDSHA